MKRIAVVAAVFSLAACAQLPPYAYKAQSENDPEITFGDRFGGGKIGSPARTFAVNTNDATANKCKDFVNVGTTSNHWSGVAPRTRVIRVPAGNTVAIGSFWLFSNTSCRPGVMMFSPENGGKYSVDIEFAGDKCRLSIAQAKLDGKFEEVKGASFLPTCTD